MIASAGCAIEGPSTHSLDTVELDLLDDVLEEEEILCDDVNVIVIGTGTNEYLILAQTLIARPVGDIWAEIRDFEQLGEIALPGLATDFQWLNGGGPEQIPSTFQFVSGGETIVEEIYYRSETRHELAYRLLEPALGMVEYDALLDISPTWNNKTYYISIRAVTLEPGVIGGLTDLIELETQNIKDYFENDGALAQ